VVAHLEALDELVADALVDGQLVADEHPALAVVVLEELGIDLGGVVDDDQDLGVRVEVGPGAVEDVVELEASWRGHAAERLVEHPRH
jgi:hypothetical protein